MRTVLEEVFMDDFTSSGLHENNCGCSRCNKNSELEALLEEDELNAYQFPAAETFEIMEEVIGTDQRREVRKVSKTTNYPFRWICALKVFARHPQDSSKTVSMPGGTGLLISPCHILTVGHNLHIDLQVRLTNGSIQTHKTWIKEIEVSPGKDGTSTPFGSYKSATFQCHPNWVNNRDKRFDFGLITLPKPIGNMKFKAINNNFLGFWGSQTHGYGTSLTPILKTSLKNKVANVAGYPTDKRGGQQWTAYDKISEINPVTANGNHPLPELFVHQVDTCVGQSGAPIWCYNSKTKKRNLVGIHHGTCEGIKGCRTVSGTPCFSGSTNRMSGNLGIFFSQSVLDTVRQWMKDKPCPK